MTPNLEEFFMVRIGSLTDLSKLKKQPIDSKSNMTAKEQIDASLDKLVPMYARKDQIYFDLIGDLADNGILKSWTSNSNYVGNAYSTKSPRTGGNYPTRGTFFNVVADESNMPLGEVNPNMNNKIWDGSGAAESPNALDVYRNYIDKITESLFPGSGHIDETRVYPKNTRVKALRGNNGDFDMSIPFIFSYNTNNKQNINETMA